MSTANDMTLAAYEEHIQEYIDNTPQQVSDNIKVWIDTTLASVDRSGDIIEIGSAFGRDANYIEAQGYTVERTDATTSFVTYLNDKGEAAHVFNILKDDFQKQYDLIFADAVFLHFSASELEVVLQKVFTALKPVGVLAFSLKKGFGEEITDRKLGADRYFCYWESQPITQLLEKVGFTNISVGQFADYRKNKQDWLHIIARKDEA